MWSKFKGCSTVYNEGYRTRTQIKTELVKRKNIVLVSKKQMLRSHLHDLLSKPPCDLPPYVVELSSDRLSFMISAYVFDLMKSEIKSAKHVGTKVSDDKKEEFTVALGCTKFGFDNHQMALRCERFGDPFPHHCDMRQFESVLLYGPSFDIIESFITAVRVKHKLKKESNFVIFKWIPKHGDWVDDSFAEARSIESVILDKKIKSEVLSDIDEFTSENTVQWYKKHHIPYRRGYMFHGPPGTGKTSIISALTTYMKRNLYRINLVAPGLCDDSLISAVQQVPEESVVMLEDIDALFGVHREKNETFNVTFSGLLNAIDGVGDSTRGVVFMFTTNHLDRVDDALKRCGRIDRSFELGHCCDQQLIDMFLRFYPGCHDHAAVFKKNVRKKTNEFSPAEAQHHFIMHRKSDSLKASTEVIMNIKFNNTDCMYN